MIIAEFDSDRQEGIYTFFKLDLKYPIRQKIDLLVALQLEISDDVFLDYITSLVDVISQLDVIENNFKKVIL